MNKKRRENKNGRCDMDNNNIYGSRRYNKSNKNKQENI